jgi:ribosomal protein L37AE/L43A
MIDLFETKEEILERMLSKEKPACPHCNQEMSIWEVPPVSFSDGLGWGTPYLYVCFNDECPLFTGGWAHLEENFGQTASYRSICYPGENNFECMPVFSKIGGQGQIIDDEALLAQETLKENMKKGFSILAGCYVEKDGVTVLRMLLDPAEPVRVRLKAAEMIGDLGELETVETLTNHKFGNEMLQENVNASVKRIHDRFFTRECPFCAEIIKQRAKICKHCGKEVAGR